MGKWTRSRDGQGGLLAVALLVAVALQGACSHADSGDAGSSVDSEPGNASGAGGSFASTGGAAAIVDGSGESDLPPETETSVAFETPAAGVRYVYAANPDDDSVAVIDAESLAIHTVQTGDEPRYLQTLAGHDAALVIDVGTRDVALIQTEWGSSSVTYLDTPSAANALAVAPDGKHAIAYFDLDKNDGSITASPQDVTVLSIDGDTHASTSMSVGFGIHQVLFGGSGNSSIAYLVTDTGVSILDFSRIDADGPGIAPTVAIFSDLEGQTADVSVTGDGRYALGRLGQSTDLRLVDLESGTATDLDTTNLFPTSEGSGGAGGAGGGNNAGQAGTAGSAGEQAGSAGEQAGTAGAGGGTAGVAAAPAPIVTDVDLSPDGRFALAVVRDRSTLLRIPIPGGFSDPAQIERVEIPGVTVGSVEIGPDAHYAVLFTNAVTSEERIVVVDLTGERQLRAINVKKAVLGVTFAAGGNQAFVVHQKLPGDPAAAGISAETSVDRSYGYSVVDLDLGFAKIVLTDADIKNSVQVPDQPYLFLTFAGDSEQIHRVNFDTLQFDQLTLGSLPVSLGVVPQAGRVFVSQDHVDGRITFIDWETLETSSVTGYELNSTVRE